MKEKVGLVGAGIMGKLMVDHMVAAGYDVYVSDPNPVSQEYCKKAGATVVENNVEIAKNVKKIIISLANPKISIAVAKELAPVVGKGHIILETSTTTPDISETIAEIYKDTGAVFCESSILGKPIVCGEWVIPAGGCADAIEEMKPILLTFAKKVERVGDIGASNKLKLLNNTMYAVINACICEVMAVADNVGVDKMKFYEIVSNSSAATNCGLFKETAYRIAIDKYDEPTATNELIRKDNHCGVALAQSVGMTPLIANTVLSQYENAVSCGYAKEDDSVLYKYFKQVYAPRKD
jgi:3-hydroxyisobutyrate dehydrogenase-like beta-hydroxyacid dehydrogenase